MKELLKTILADQQSLSWSERYIRREIPDSYLNGPDILVISGIRRCGKSTLLQQIRESKKERDYFLNFDDERLVHMTAADLQLLHETFMELFGVQTNFYFDEIQNVPGWERFVRRLHDAGNKVFVTGSNATMLSRELGTHLTGRYLPFELFPFSFREFLKFSGHSLSSLEQHSSHGRSLIQKWFLEYFNKGGFPGFLSSGNPETLKSLYQSILYRDVMVRNHLTSEKEMLELVYYLASNIARPTTNSSLALTIGVKNATTIRNYLGFLENTYLLFQLHAFDYSVKKQLRNPRKTYFIDIALVRTLGFLFSDESGRLLENLVFIELKRRGLDIYYHKGKKECDFVIRHGTGVSQAIQVCHTLDSQETRNRELAGLLDAMTVYNLAEGRILTASTEEKFTSAKGTILIQPVWKWLMEVLRT